MFLTNYSSILKGFSSIFHLKTEKQIIPEEMYSQNKQIREFSTITFRRTRPSKQNSPESDDKNRRFSDKNDIVEIGLR